MSGVFIGHSHPRHCSGQKTWRRCRNNEEADNVILIDVDSENFENVIIIDVPESLPKKRPASRMLRKDKKWSFKNVIYIDDDDDETRESSHSFGGNKVNFSAGTSSNRESYRDAKSFADAAVEDCQFVQDSAIPVRLSKCKRTYSGKAATSNRYGLNIDSESDSSDDDCPECELVEDTSGEVQELWEKAFSRRRKDIRNGHSSIRDHGSTSRVADGENHKNVEMEDAAGQHEEASFCSNKEKFSKEDDAPSHFRTNEERGDHPASSTSAFQEQSTKEFDHPTSGFEDKETSRVEICPPKFQSYVNEDSCYGKSSPLEGEATLCKSKNSFDNEVIPSRTFPRDDYRNFREMATGSVEEREHLESGQPHATRSAVGSIFSKSLMSLGDDIGKGYHQENGQQVREINIHHNKAKLREDISVSNIQPEEDNDDQLHGQKEDEPSVETCIINDREKLKETDEYKRALEEEWAARQQALQIQAEEAQRLRRLRKRSKAESIRLLDMERRQKQRVEEMRNTQKKDEENMNLKEKICADVRKELKKLEAACRSMASLLHLLGIRVGGWPNPSPQEVQTAYKRALLTFHPDRAAKSDIRQQVEAEEKFKLINRLKEKFPPSS